MSRFWLAKTTTSDRHAESRWYTGGARIIERSQEYKSTVKYRTFVLLRVPIPRGVGKFNYRTGIRSIIKFPRSIFKLLLAPIYNTCQCKVQWSLDRRQDENLRDRPCVSFVTQMRLLSLCRTFKLIAYLMESTNAWIGPRNTQDNFARNNDRRRPWVKDTHDTLSRGNRLWLSALLESSWTMPWKAPWLVGECCMQHVIQRKVLFHIYSYFVIVGCSPSLLLICLGSGSRLCWVC